MNIFVCTKLISSVVVNGDFNVKKSSKYKDNSYTINPSDLWAIEKAVQIKKLVNNCKVTLITVVPPVDERLLRRCLSIGADDVIWIWDKELESVNSYSVGKTIAKTIKDNKFDIVICGNKSFDTNDGYMGYLIADFLDIPIVPNVISIKFNKLFDKAIIERKIQKGYKEIVDVQIPVVITIDSYHYDPHYRSLPEILVKSKLKNIKRVGLKDIGISEESIIFKEFDKNITKITTPKCKPRSIFTPDSSLSVRDRMNQIFSGGLAVKKKQLFFGTPDELSEKIISYLKQYKFNINLQ